MKIKTSNYLVNVEAFDCGHKVAVFVVTPKATRVFFFNNPFSFVLDWQFKRKMQRRA